MSELKPKAGDNFQQYAVRTVNPGNGVNVRVVEGRRGNVRTSVIRSSSKVDKK